MPECFICAKHQDLDALAGGTIFSDENAIVTHRPRITPDQTAESVYLGYLFVESRRHIAGLHIIEPLGHGPKPFLDRGLGGGRQGAQGPPVEAVSQRNNPVLRNN